jgi:hypothetical protein
MAERVTKKEADGEHPAEHYAYVPDPTKSSTWKLRIDDAEHVGGAAAALGPGYRGEKAEIPDADRSKVVAKVRAAWKKFHPDAKDDEMPEALKAAEPTLTQVHVNAPLGAVRAEPMGDGQDDDEDDEEEGEDQDAEPTAEKPGRPFLTKMIEHLRGMVRPDQYDEAMRKARAHAGGRARSDARQSAEWMGEQEEGDEPHLRKDDPAVHYRASTDPDQACSGCRFFCGATCTLVEGSIDPNGVCDLFHSRENVYRERTFKESTERLCFADAPTRIPFLPMPGRYTHPSYGEIRLTPERLANFVKNFNAGIYQKQVPLDAEHQTKLSGAVGWVKQLSQNPDGSVDAMVEWTDRGRSFLEANRYKFVSPEWYDDWTDPATTKTYRDVVIGGALTTRPFFKESVLRPLAAGETATPRTWLPIQSKGATMPTQQRRAAEDYSHTHEHSHGDETHSHEHDHGGDVPQGDGHPEAHRHDHEGGEDKAMSEKRFAEMEAQNKAFKEQLEKQAAESAKQAAELKAATDRLATMTDEAQTKRFTDEVLGRNSANGIRWIGDTAKHVGHLKKLAKAFGEDSEEVRYEIEQNRAHAEQMRTSGLFSERGSEAFGGDGDAESEFDAAVKRAMAEHKLDYGTAFSRVQRDNPALARRFSEQMRGGR